MSHDEASELLGAYALDAVDGDEARELEAHLETCPRCRAELDSLREVAAAMGNSVEPLPEGLWSQIASQLPERQDDEEPPPMPAARRPRRPLTVPGSRRRPQSPPAHHGHRWSAPSPWPPRPSPSCWASGSCGPTTRSRTSSRPRRGPRPTVTAALHTPGHRLVSLEASSHTPLAQVVVVPSGQGYLVSSNLPRPGQRPDLPALGHRRASRRSRSACSGDSPRSAAFTMAGSTRPSRLSITAEPAGGAVAPTGPIVATGTV